ncbi:alpha/beta-hydrolase [Trametes cingulata]|nr:alpha/beta-hydrolase [Trametes cingulata]
MSSSNINDAGAIQALLDQLRSSEAWQKAVNANAAAGATTQVPAPSNAAAAAASSSGTVNDTISPSDVPHAALSSLQAPETTSQPGPSNSQSVASLLSQLQASSTFAAAVAGPSGTPGPSLSARVHPPAGSSDFPGPDAALPASTTTVTTSAPAPSPTPRRQDLRACTFQQALPHLARLAGDDGFLKALTAMRAEQADLERQLWRERREIQRKHEERVKTARTKATIIGAGLTQYEADTLTDSFRAELLRFDRERVLPAWDGLLKKQQAALETLGVPAMFPTTQTADREDVVRRLASIIVAAATSHCSQTFHTTEMDKRCACASCSGYRGSTRCLLASSPRSVTMPYVDLVSSDDYAAIWYTTNAPAGNVSGFDPEKPTLIMLHPLFLDSTWLHPQLDDPRLNSNFNIVVFDLRTTGKSLYRPSGRYDLWVTAADLAHCFYHLRLSPAHIFAPELFSYTALRFAALFPELCLSLTLCNVTPQTELKSIFEAFEELCHLWCYAEDLESFETACKELINCYALLVAFWEVHYPPFRRTFVITNVNLVLNRTPMSPDELASVRCPVLIIQAERSPTHPMEYAQQLRQALVNVPNGAQLFNVKATHGYLSLLSSSIVNQVLNKFLTRQPPARSDLDPPAIPLRERMKMALAQLAEWKEDPSLAEQDPLSPLSFSCVTEEVRKSQDELYAIYQEGVQTAFSPLAPDGRPLRKWRKDEHWMESGADGFSYTNVKQFQDRISEQNRDKRRPGQRPPGSRGGGGGSSGSSNVGALGPDKDSLLFTPSEPVTQELQQVARIRRATVIPPGTADKHVIKGSMAKVIASGTGTSLQRRLLR